jgi:hypothetical protein
MQMRDAIVSTLDPNQSPNGVRFACVDENEPWADDGELRQEFDDVLDECNGLADDIEDGNSDISNPGDQRQA